MKYLLFLSILLVAGQNSCEKENIEAGIRTDADLAEELKTVPEKITIEGKELELTTYLWRDFMPIAEEGGSALICVNKLTEINEKPLPEEITLIKQHVVKGNEIWTAPYSETKNSPKHILEGVVRNGPKWGPGIEVDVICEFEHEGTIHRIIAKSQTIHKTQ